MKTISAVVLAWTLTACAEDVTAQSQTRSSASEAVRQQVETLFASIDRDQDGALTYQEILDSNLSYNNRETGEQYQGERAARAWIETFDLNRDARITKTEMLSEVERLAEAG